MSLKERVGEFTYDLTGIITDTLAGGRCEARGIAKTCYNHFVEGAWRVATGKNPIDYSELTEHTIVFVHGYLQGEGFDLTMRKRARREARDTVVPFIYTPSLQDIRLSAAQLNEFLEERLAEHSAAKEFTLVGHSQGGLVCRYLVESFRHLPIRGVVTLGTPHHGTRLARYAHGTGAEQMRPGSEFLRNMEHHPLSVPYTSIYTIYDQIVKPFDSAELEGAINIVLGEGEFDHIKVGHAGLLEDREVYNLLMRCIESNPLPENPIHFGKSY